MYTSMHETDCVVIVRIYLMNMQQAEAAGEAGTLLSDNTW